MEKELRKAENLRGTPMVLCNGETWTVPSLPFGKIGKAIAKEYDTLAEKDFQNDTDGAMQGMLSVMVAHLRVNYPGLTQDVAEEEGLFDIEVFGEFCSATSGPELKKA